MHGDEFSPPIGWRVAGSLASILYFLILLAPRPSGAGVTLVEFPGGNSNRYMKVGQVNPQAMAGGAESQAGGGAPAFLTGDQIRQRLAGNTIKFFNRRRKANVLLFLGADGVATGWIDGASGGDVRQTWWIGEDDRLCRQLGPKKRQVCNTLAIDGEGFAFHKKDGSVLFRATLLPGNQVSGQTIQESPAGRGGRGPAGGQGGGTGRGAPDPAQMIGRMDADGDGVVSREEFPGPAQRFDMVDADGDGFLRAEEFAQAMAGRGAQRGGDGQRMTARPSGGGQGSAGGRQEPSAQDMIGRMDRDGDGKIGPDEFPGGADPFKKLDTNKDGFITEDEIETRLAKRSEYPLDREARQAYRQARRLPGRTDGRDCRFDRPGPGSGHFVVETYSPNCAFNGTTLPSGALSMNRTNRTRPVILELDMAGKVVWQHKVKDGVGRWLTDKWMYDSAAVDASRLASGNTLFLLLNYGVFEIDRAGKLVWERRDGKISHDADRLHHPNGNTIYVRRLDQQGR